jgi:hypothetical protein
MTPLALAIINDRLQPKHRRRFNDLGGVAAELDGDWLCFETSEVFEACRLLVSELARNGIRPPMLRLPAPKTWIEFNDPDSGARTGYLLMEAPSGVGIAVSAKSKDRFGSVVIGRLDRDEPCYIDCQTTLQAGGQSVALWAIAMVYLVNCPRWFGRRQHDTHAGLARKLKASRPMIGSFPLRGWTEIVLQTQPDMAADVSVEGVSGAERCFHAVRGHWRIYADGRDPIWQPYHWRGNPTLGIKRSRYRLAAPA